jgi:hypothetical protein
MWTVTLLPRKKERKMFTVFLAWHPRLPLKLFLRQNNASQEIAAISCVNFVHQGCQIFLDKMYQNWAKIYQIATKLPKHHKMYQMGIIYSKWPKSKPKVFHSKALKISPNWDFWFENIPSGNPVVHTSQPSTRTLGTRVHK